jgi:hypothetical protein
LVSNCRRSLKFSPIKPPKSCRSIVKFIFDVKNITKLIFDVALLFDRNEQICINNPCRLISLLSRKCWHIPYILGNKPMGLFSEQNLKRLTFCSRISPWAYFRVYTVFALAFAKKRNTIFVGKCIFIRMKLYTLPNPNFYSQEFPQNA